MKGNHVLIPGKTFLQINHHPDASSNRDFRQNLALSTPRGWHQHLIITTILFRADRLLVGERITLGVDS
ncbi:MAG: hypothetical protein WD491_14175 [Balneolales bacterium]